MAGPRCGARGETIVLTAIATPRLLRIVSREGNKISVQYVVEVRRRDS
jgi:hypothetical protein